jgi:hypothetical protein
MSNTDTASGTYPITGILKDLGPAPNQVPLRQEVDAWFTNPENKIQVNLFLLALKSFQEMPADDMLSYFQVAGQIRKRSLLVMQTNFSNRHSWSTAGTVGRGYCHTNTTHSKRLLHP